MTVKVNNIYMKIGLLMIVSSLLLLTTACGNDAPEGVDQDLWDGYKKYSKLIEDKWKNDEELTKKEIIAIDNFINEQKRKELNEGEQYTIDYIESVLALKNNLDETTKIEDILHRNELIQFYYKDLCPEIYFGIDVRNK